MRIGKKRYVRMKRCVRTGGGPPLHERVIDMIYDVVVEPVERRYMRLNHQSVESLMLYDQHNIFGCKKDNIVLIYDIPDHDRRIIYYLDAERTFAAVDAYEYEQRLSATKPRAHASACWQEVRSMADAHMQRLVRE